MKIKDIEIDFDLLDADDIERFENGLKEVTEKSQIEEELSYSEAIRRECKIVEDFFDYVFGEGISQKIFKGKMNLTEHIEVFKDIVNEKIKKEKELETMFDKYKPNRNERRYDNSKRYQNGNKYFVK